MRFYAAKSGYKRLFVEIFTQSKSNSPAIFFTKIHKSPAIFIV